DGLKIYSTLDSKMQKFAEEAVSEHMKNEQKKFFAHWGGKNPWTDEQGVEITNFIWNAAKRTSRYKSLSAEHSGDSARIFKELSKPLKMKIFSWKGEIDTLISPLDSIKWYKKYLHAGFMAMDPHTGNIKAWV